MSKPKELCQCKHFGWKRTLPEIYTRDIAPHGVIDFVDVPNVGSVPEGVDHMFDNLVNCYERVEVPMTLWEYFTTLLTVTQLRVMARNSGVKGPISKMKKAELIECLKIVSVIYVTEPGVEECKQG